MGIPSHRVRLTRQFEQAVSEHPDSVPLRLNYGQFLLKHLDVDGAEQQFRSALKLDKGNPEVHLGLGLVAFEQKSYEDAWRISGRSCRPSSFALFGLVCLCGESRSFSVKFQRPTGAG